MNQFPAALPFCSVRIQYSGAPGSVEAQVSSVESNGNLVVDSRVQNEGNGWAGSGANPWHLDSDTESILFLTNESAQPARIGFKVTANGSPTYYLTSLKLNPHETRAIDLRKLRDAQKPDFMKNTIPAAASDGSVTWLRIDNVPVMGRLMLIHRQQGMASNYDCCTCGCPLSYMPGLGYVSPATSNLLVQGTVGLILYGGYWNCNDDPFYYDVNGSATWSSQYPTIASVNSSGTVTGQSGGTTSITGQHSDYSYYYNPLEPPYCIGTLLSGIASGQENVCQLGISSPANGQVFSLGGSNYNSATIPLEATSACSGTANWTLLFSYTTTGGATYTDTQVTSTTINAPNNYNYNTSPGDAGQVSLSASALLAGQQFNVKYTVYVDGTAIPSATITNRLVGLYSGATAGLLTGIAWVETAENYQQFVSRSLYQVPSGLWPIEGPGGGYVGLMMVPNSCLLNAFDWMTNTSQGLSIFNGKYSTVQKYVSSQQNGHSALPNLTPTQYEDNQLLLYGG
jgi:hypothetical protein